MKDFIVLIAMIGLGMIIAGYVMHFSTPVGALTDSARTGILDTIK